MRLINFALHATNNLHLIFASCAIVRKEK